MKIHEVIFIIGYLWACGFGLYYSIKNIKSLISKKTSILTNGDRIRSMNDEDLAVFLLTEECKVCKHCKYNGEYGCEDIDGMVCGNQHLEKTWKEWLASDCEETNE